MNDAPALLRLLGDETRLRLLRLLANEALNVSELTAILGVAQSGVSRHLGLLREAGLVSEQRSGPFSWYRLAAESNGSDPKPALWAWLREEFSRPTPMARADDARLAEVRRVRKESFAAHSASDERRQLVPGRSWAAWARALALLLPALDVADFGCGEGYLTIETARWARRVIAIDRSKEVLTRGRALAARRRVRNISWKQGAIDHAPLADAAVDVVLLSQALHHAERPELVLAEAARVLRPAGRVLILDLREHTETWVRAKLGDQWLGFTDRRLGELIESAGFDKVVVRVGARRSGDPFTVLIASGTKSAT